MKNQKPTSLLYADVFFPQLEKELTSNPDIIGNLYGYFIVHVTKKGTRQRTWHVVLKGKENVP
jgi:hypothetical protein